MWIQQQEPALPIENLDFTEECKVPNKHGKLLPNSIRAIFCGPSGCGKTNAVLSLLFNPNGVRFENVYVYSKSLYQPKYNLLKEVLENTKSVKYRDNDDIVDPSEARENSIFIFDDIACEKQNKIKEFFSMGRHKSVDVIYLCQTYSKIPKQLIRDNCNIIVLFKQDDVNLRHAFDEHVSPDFDYEKFKQMCSQCWCDKYGNITIVKDFELKHGRYRKGFDKYISM